MLRWMLVALAAASAVSPAFAQNSPTTADLVGVVRDPNGGGLRGATVTATQLSTNISRATVADATGRFIIPALQPDTYAVQAQLPGFETVRLPSVRLALGNVQDLVIVLPVAKLAETVDVTSTAPAVTEATLSHVISRQQIDSLPINGRNFISFSRLTPTVTVDRTPQQGASASSGLSFAGQRARSNNITVDGLDNNDSQVGAVRATFSQEAVQEFQVLAHSFAAEFGRASGGVVNIVTRSGGNRPSGTFFTYGRDDSLNAREYFERFDPSGAAVSRPKAPYSRWQYGAVGGGPIRRDRTFAFASIERHSADVNNFVTIDDSTIISVFGQPRGTTVDLLRQAGLPVETGNVGYRVRSTQGLAKVDHHLADSLLSVRYSYAQGLDENIEPFGGIVDRSRGAALDNTDHTVSGSHLVVRGSWVNEVRAQLAFRDQIVRSLDPRCDGECDLESEGGPTVEIVGVASVGRQRFTPQVRDATRWQIVNTLSYYRGSHTVKTGVDFNTSNLTRATAPIHFGGRFIFSSLPAIPGVLPTPVSSIQAFALGLPAAYVQGYGTSNAEFRTSDFSLFLQDDWRIRPNLTISAGLRYQRQFWPGFALSAPGLGQYHYPSDSNDFAPRVSFVWDVKGDGRTAVRGAFGLFYDNQIVGPIGIAKVIDGTATGLRTLVARFPNSLVAWGAPGRVIPEPAGGYTSLVTAVDPAAKTPFARHASAGVSRQVGTAMRLSVTALWARGFNQFGGLDYNPLVASLGAGRRPLDVNGVPGTSASVLQYTSFGETWYRAIVFEAERRLTDGFQFLVSYTLSKAEDNSTDFITVFLPQNLGAGRDPNDPGGLPIGFDPGSERGPALHDQRHRFVASGTYVAPADIQISGIINVASGAPFNILAGVDLNADGDGGNFPSDRARRTLSDPSSSVGRNAGRLDVDATVDLRVSRRFALSSRVYADVIGEVFNLFNRSNIIEVNNVFGTGSYPTAPSPVYGQPTVVGPPRQMQIGVRIGF